VWFWNPCRPRLKRQTDQVFRKVGTLRVPGFVLERRLFKREGMYKGVLFLNHGGERHAGLTVMATPTIYAKAIQKEGNSLNSGKEAQPRRLPRGEREAW